MRPYVTSQEDLNRNPWSTGPCNAAGIGWEEAPCTRARSAGHLGRQGVHATTIERATGPPRCSRRGDRAGNLPAKVCMALRSRAQLGRQGAHAITIERATWPPRCSRHGDRGRNLVAKVLTPTHEEQQWTEAAIVNTAKGSSGMTPASARREAMCLGPTTRKTRETRR